MSHYNLSDPEREILRHALGLNRAEHQFRNHFTVTPGDGDDVLCWKLYMYGYMAAPVVPEWMGGSRLYQVTQMGIDAVTPENKDIT